MTAGNDDRVAPPLDHRAIGLFYDRRYHESVTTKQMPSMHLRRLARRFSPWTGRRALDVACGTGQWLQAIAANGGIPVGIDISDVALNICRNALPQAELHCGPAERLPFEDGQFDFISCLGALEHFLDPKEAMKEMKRVAKPDALLLLLVPNADFLPAQLGLYRGTWQSSMKEEARSLLEWQELFESAGLRVQARWRDLHILSLSWIFRGGWFGWPGRAAIALALLLWPLSWQYQVYHLCVPKKCP